jgi:hypothetical protein
VKNNIRGNDGILLSDHEYRQITPEELAKVMRSQNGGGGTAPIAITEIVSFLDKSQKWHLILITDGHVGVTSIAPLLRSLVAFEGFSDEDRQC